MLRRWLCALLMIVPHAAFAEVTAVQLGVHEDYTRLVFTLPEGEPNWDVTTTRATVAVDIEGVEGFDLSQFADRPAGSRISGTAVVASGQRLHVTMACDCTVESFVINKRYLAIDISSPVAQTTAPSANTPDLAADFTDLARPWHDPATQALQPFVANEADTLPLNTFPDLGSIVSSGLATATYQGFLSLPDQEQQSPAQLAQNIISQETLDALAVGIATHSSVVADNIVMSNEVDMTPTCNIIEDQLQSAIRTDVSFSLAIGDIRQVLVDEEENPNPSATLELAQHYIMNGMGTEALYALRSITRETPSIAAMRYIAGVLDDHDHPAPFDLFLCSDNIAIWQFLDLNAPAPDVTDPNGLLLAYKIMPEILQHRIRDQFATALATHGFPGFQHELDTFMQARSAETRLDSGSENPAAYDLPNDPARAILRTELTPDNLDPALATSMDPESLDTIALASLRMENRGTPVEATLLRHEIARYLAELDFMTALGTLDDARDRIGDEAYFAALSEQIAPDLHRMTDAEAVAFAFRQDLPELNDEIVAQISARVADLGVTAPPGFAAPERETPEPAAQDTQQAVSPNIFSPLPVVFPPEEEGPPSVQLTESILGQSQTLRSEIQELLRNSN